MTEVDEATHPPEPPPAPSEGEPAPSPEGSLEPVAAPIPLDKAGRERPRFLLAFPEDPELQRLVRAFEVGDYRTVRAGAPKLVASSDDPIVRAAARELHQRIDPLMKYLLWVAIGLFVFVVWYTYQGQPH
jgi:hypothetical protein